uniref:Uncharacterized protein n=1 Tax=Arundo donax TaxID=35708 RepID=A0A0A9E9U3_ARUDO
MLSVTKNEIFSIITSNISTAFLQQMVCESNVSWNISLHLSLK